MDEATPKNFWDSRNLTLTAWVFLRLLAVIYLIAFLSFAVQWQGLVGSRGILPAADFLQAVKNQAGSAAYVLIPTLAWLNSSDMFLNFLCIGGILLSLAAVFDLAAAGVFMALWVFYLSLVNTGQDFLSFQWDILLLETGFLAVFLASFHILPRYPLTTRGKPPMLVIALMRWLLFRLMWSSGLVKLTSGDLTWRNLTALNYHYETQPLPTWVGWFAHQLPPWFQKFSVGAMFFIELFIPFLIFAPRRARFIAFGCFVFFQVLIMATGNYCFFNFLTLILCLLLLDDGIWPQKMRRWAGIGQPESAASRQIQSEYWPKLVIIPLALTVFAASLYPLTRALGVRSILPRPLTVLYSRLQPFHIVNGYGLFAVMTTSRPEIMIEGSMDGIDWKTYDFKWKPGPIKRLPAFVQPHQPRLDWQMWFAALGNYRENPWLIRLLVRLLEGSRPVLDLMGDNPFEEKPPQYIRAVLYDYRFTDWRTWRKGGAWWQRKKLGLYTPVLTRKGEQIIATSTGPPR